MLLLRDLPPPLAACVRPGEVRDGDEEEGVTAVKDTGEGIVPRREGGEDAKVAASLDELGVGCAGVAVKVSDGEHEEGEVEHKEEEEEGHRGLQRAYEHEKGEYEPALPLSANRISRVFLAHPLQTCLAS